MKLNINKIMSLVLAIGVLAVPVSAYAKDRGDDMGMHKGMEKHSSSLNEFGVQVQGGMGLPGLFYRGTVTATSGTGFSFKNKKGIVYTVTTASAKIVQIPNTVINLSGIGVNDTVAISGNLAGSTIDASVVFVSKANQVPAKAKGAVTAVNGSTVTLQTKNNKSVTVNTSASTNVVKADGTTGTVTADVVVGAKVKASGLWDTILHTLSAWNIILK